MEFESVENNIKNKKPALFGLLGHWGASDKVFEIMESRRVWFVTNNEKGQFDEIVLANGSGKWCRAEGEDF
jgi:hypothetical protein